MGTRFTPLPLDQFDESLRPHIARLNNELRTLFGLEGALVSSSEIKRRSDASIVRNVKELINVTKIVNIDTATQIDRLAALGTGPANQSIFRVLTGPPDQLYVWMQGSAGWGWFPIVFAP